MKRSFLALLPGLPGLGSSVTEGMVMLSDHEGWQPVGAWGGWNVIKGWLLKEF